MLSLVGDHGLVHRVIGLGFNKNTLYTEIMYLSLVVTTL